MNKQKEQDHKELGRGFALMSPEKRREVASRGGKAAHIRGRAHRWTSEEAQAAGRKGYLAKIRSQNSHIEPRSL